MDTRSFVILLQFLTYAQHLDFEIECLGGIPYRQVTFKVRDFLEFQNPTVKSTNHFQCLVAIPQVKLEKSSKQKYWIGRVWLVEELFYYNYPFSLPNIFQTKLTKDQLEVQYKIVQVFSTVNIEKTFLVEEFLDNYPSILSNQQKTKIKKYFIDVIQIFEKYKLIEPNYKIIVNGKYHQTDQLTPHNISEGFIIYEKINF